MSPVPATVLYIVVLCAASAAWQFGRTVPRLRPFRPWVTISALVIIAVPSILQLTLAPQLLGAWRRDGFSGWLAAPYRLVTSLVVQDGGWPGTAWNLAALVWIGLLAESLWTRGRWILIALGAGIGAQAFGWLVQPVGAGNSVVVFGLAASLLVLGVRSRHPAARVAGILGLLASGVLCVGGDIHGGAALIGALLALVLLVRDSRTPTNR